MANNKEYEKKKYKFPSDSEHLSVTQVCNLVIRVGRKIDYFFYKNWLVDISKKIRSKYELRVSKVCNPEENVGDPIRLSVYTETSPLVFEIWN